MSISATIKNYLNKAKDKVKEDVKGRLKAEFITPYQPKTEAEAMERMDFMNKFNKFEKNYNMMQDARKGIMNEDMYNLMMKNIATRNAKKKK